VSPEQIAKLEAVARTGHRRTDQGNAERLVATHGADLRYVPGLGWHHWPGQRWAADEDGEAMRRMKATVRDLYAEAAGLEDEGERKSAASHAAKSDSEPRLRAAVTLAQTERAVIVPLEALDAQPDLLAVANGTVDLTTGELRQARRDDLLTRGTQIAYDPDAQCPRFERFVAEVFAGDLELVEFVQRFAGYTLTGHTGEQVLAVFHGTGGNGKSALVTVLRALLGDLAAAAPFDTFIAARGPRGPRDDLARLRGARLVTASESGEGRRLDEATVKEVTGGDTIAARHLYGRYFEFVPAFKIVLVTNHCPHVDADDEAIWRRLRLVPFTQRFEPGAEPDLAATLHAELPGILAWAVRGCVAWQHEGLGQAGAVTQATASYRADEDTIGRFLEDTCQRGGEIPALALRDAYQRWCETNGERTKSSAVLGKRLKSRRILSERRAQGALVYVGIRLAVTAGDGTNPQNGNSPRVREWEEVSKTASLPSPAVTGYRR
jgi:putative DNA primase/helicase